MVLSLHVDSDQSSVGEEVEVEGIDLLGAQRLYVLAKVLAQLLKNEPAGSHSLEHATFLE